LRRAGDGGSGRLVNAADPRVRRTRRLLQDAFVGLLGEKTFEAITVQDIAARSTINRATFYAHFVDKYDLFAQFSREWFRSALDRQLPRTAAYNPANLRLLLLATMHALADLNDHCRPTEALKPLIVSAVQEELAELLREWLTPLLGGPLHAAKLEPAVAALSWAIFGAAMQWSQLSTRPPAEPIAAQVATILIHGLPSETRAH
jgi:AcrR family transcriptional regulator